MPVVVLGNPQAIDSGKPIEGVQITTAVIPEDRTLAEAVRDVSYTGDAGDGFWTSHSSAAAPSWVESDNPALAQALATHYGCPVGRP